MTCSATSDFEIARAQNGRTFRFVKTEPDGSHQSGRRYAVVVDPSAARDLRKIKDPATVKKLGAKLGSLADNPRPRGVEKLKGSEQTYRLRVGNFRIVYDVLDARVTVLVLCIDDRKDVYRRVNRG